MAFAPNIFFAQLKPFTRGFDQVQVDSVNAILRHSEGLPTAQRAYIFATAWHESHLRPVREGFAGTDAKAREIIKHRKYGFADKITGQVYYGRGLVQLTWKRNYEFAGKQLGLDLVNHPDLALEPENAARILVVGMRDGWFTGRKLNNYINAVKFDYEGARAIVNGTDKAALIAGYARQMEAMLRKAAA